MIPSSGPADPASTLAPVLPLFRAVVRATVPSAEGFDEARWTRAEEIVEVSLADRTGAMRRQVVLFLRLLDVLARVRFGRGLARLDPGLARRLLGRLERAPVLLLRRGVWGVRTLAFMGCYGQEAARVHLGYAAAAAGWEARGAHQGPWPERRGAGAPEPGTLVARTGSDERSAPSDA